MRDGKTIGSIVIEEKISTGESGETYLGRQPGLERAVVLRKLRRDLLGSPSVVERFRREARLSARVQHPSVVQVFDFFADRGDHYLVLEHVDGPTLRAILESTGKLPSDIAIRVALELARGLEEIQRRGIIHSDVRPENVQVSRWGEVKLTGFASAREVGELEPPEPIEITAYTAPELRLGSEIDRQADVYSLGAVVCELLSGRPPDGGLVATAATRPLLARTLRRALQESPKSRPSLGALRRSLERCVGRGEEDSRIEIAAWMWEIRMLRPKEPALREAEPAAEPPADATPAFERWKSFARDKRILPVATAAAVIVALGLAFGLAELRSTPRDPLPEVGSPAVSAPPPTKLRREEIKPAAPVKPALVSFVVVPWAEIQVGKASPFLTPRAAPVELAPGKHEVSFRHPKYGEVHRKFVVRPGERRVVRHAFERINP
jgi:serine/threonine protein kinase